MHELAPYAMNETASRGRRYAEAAHPFRTLYQRDRERVVHSSAFRRMTGKTQVLVASVNDHHRTRLTHTLEVTQIARTVARRLRLNEDLVEVIALAHDIGHPPFGHAGEAALHECLLDHGGFNHNLYGLRRVDWLEERYPDFPGLNLSFEVREAFVRHAGQSDPDFPGSPLIEGEVVDAVDSIAYNTHDLDDALGLEFITLADVEQLTLPQQALKAVRATYANLPPYALRVAMIRELLALQVTALVDETTRRISSLGIDSQAAVRACPEPIVGLSEPLASHKKQLERFLLARVYCHHRVLRMKAQGQRILKGLFGELLAQPHLLPERHLRRWANHPLAPIPMLPGRVPEPHLPRVVGDYLAGMTDRFAISQYRKLFSPSIDL